MSWKELIIYFSFLVILVLDTASRNKTSVCMPAKGGQYGLGGCSVGFTDWGDLWGAPLTWPQ
jgi:hypothetical protein